MKLTDLSPTQASDLAKACAVALLDSPWLARRRWRECIVVIDPSADPVAMSRASFVGWCLAHDLGEIANEATKRRVPRDHVLVLFSADTDATAGFELGCLPLLEAIRSHWVDAA